MMNEQIYVMNHSTPLHLRLTHQQWIAETNGLTAAQIRVLYYIKTLDPFGDRELDLSVTQMAKDLGCSKGTVSKALKALDTQGLIDLELTQVKIRVTAKGRKIDVSQEGGCFPQETVFPTGNSGFLQETQVSYRKRQFPTGNTQGLEPSQGAGSEVFHTIQTNSNTLTQEGESENFELPRRRIHRDKGTECSNSNDPWMNGVNPNPEFKEWLFEKRKAEGSKIASLANAAAEIRNDYLRASDLWQEFQRSVKGVEVGCEYKESDYPELLASCGSDPFKFAWMMPGVSRQEGERRIAWMEREGLFNE